jgi:DNA-binding PadR family transcriptional regulator
MYDLKPSAYHILLALADRDRHGYGIMTDVLEQTGGRLRLWPGALYGTIKGLCDAGLVQEVKPPADAPRDRMHRRFYRLTAPGRAALAEETRRLAGYVNMARMRKVRVRL